MSGDPIRHHPAIHVVPEGRTGHSVAFERQFAGEAPVSSEEEDEVRQVVTNAVTTASYPAKRESTYQIPVRSEQLRRLAESLIPEALRVRITVYVYV